MKSFLSFSKKEFLEHFRSARIFIIAGIFLLFGVMSPALAKFTPMLVEMLSESMAQSGMQIAVGEVTALDSWAQFFKNIPIALIAFIILESNIFTKEYQKGTLVLALTKGLKRYKVVVAKAVVMLVIWTAGYFVCFGLTYFINSFMWDNSVAQHLAFATICWWLMGIMTICLIVLFSSVAKSNIMVLAGAGGVVFVSYLIGMLPRIGKFFPTMLMSTSNLIYGAQEISDFKYALIVTIIICVVSLVVSIPLFNKRHI